MSQTIANIESELKEARYQIEGILRELKQVEQNGYLSMEYIEEKLESTKFQCKRIAQMRGFLD